MITSRLRAPATSPTPPARPASAVAVDHRLAEEFARLSGAGAVPGARQVVAGAALGILRHCADRPSSVVASLATVEKQAKESDQVGDEILARWCICLYQEVATRSRVSF